MHKNVPVLLKTGKVVTLSIDSDNMVFCKSRDKYYTTAIIMNNENIYNILVSFNGNIGWCECSAEEMLEIVGRC